MSSWDLEESGMFRGVSLNESEAELGISLRSRRSNNNTRCLLGLRHPLPPAAPSNSKDVDKIAAAAGGGGAGC